MTQEALKLARQLLWRYRHEIPIGHQPYMICHQVDEAFERIDEALAQPEHKCNSHPKAPHGFNRNASHANDRYTCECESWDAYEAGYQAGVTAGIEMSTETEQKPVAWLGFNERGECREVFTPKMKETFPNYPTADMIPVYTTPPQPEQEPVAWVDPATLYQLKIGLEGVHLVYETEMVNSLPLYDKPQIDVGCAECGVNGGHALYCVACAEKFVGGYKDSGVPAVETGLEQVSPDTPPQRKPLTSKEIRAIEVEVAMSNSFAHPTKAEEFVRAIEAAHGIRD